MPKQNTPPASTPQAVIQQIEQLAQNIVIARKRRRETQAQWAKRLGISQPTMARLERGDPAVAMATYVMCMWLIKPSVGLADLIAPQADDASLELEVARLQPWAIKTQSSAHRKLKTVADVQFPVHLSPGEKVSNPKKDAKTLSIETRTGKDFTQNITAHRHTDLTGNSELHKQLDKLTHNERTAAGLAALLKKSGRKFP